MPTRALKEREFFKYGPILHARQVQPEPAPEPELPPPGICAMGTWNEPYLAEQVEALQVKPCPGCLQHGAGEGARPRGSGRLHRNWPKGESASLVWNEGVPVLQRRVTAVVTHYFNKTKNHVTCDDGFPAKQGLEHVPHKLKGLHPVGRGRQAVLRGGRDLRHVQHRPVLRKANVQVQHQHRGVRECDVVVASLAELFFGRRAALGGWPTR